MVKDNWYNDAKTPRVFLGEISDKYIGTIAFAIPQAIPLMTLAQIKNLMLGAFAQQMQPIKYTKPTSPMIFFLPILSAKNPLIKAPAKQPTITIATR